MYEHLKGDLVMDDPPPPRSENSDCAAGPHNTRITDLFVLLLSPTLTRGFVQLSIYTQVQIIAFLTVVTL